MSDCQGDAKLECDGGSVATRAFWSSMSLVSNLLLLISKKAISGKNYPNQPPSLIEGTQKSSIGDDPRYFECEINIVLQLGEIVQSMIVL